MKPGQGGWVTEERVWSEEHSQVEKWQNEKLQTKNKFCVFLNQQGNECKERREEDRRYEWRQMVKHCRKGNGTCILF